MSDRQKSPLGLKIIGIGKLVTSVMLAGLGLGIFHFMDQDSSELIERFIAKFHLNPEGHLLNKLLEWGAGIDDTHLHLFGIGALFYAALHALEGVGLLLEKKWAEYLVIIITASLLPLEAYEIYHKLSFLRIGVLVINVSIVVYLIRQLRRKKITAAISR